MNKPTHVIGGVTAGIAVNQFIVPHITNSAITPESIVGIASVMAGAFIGSVLPDIDHKGSFIGRRLKPISFILHHTVGHRGMTHAPLVSVIFVTVLSFGVLHLTTGFVQTMLFYFLLGLFAGIASHLFLDALTKGGIPLLYPFSSKHYSIGRFKTGGIGEYVVSFALILCILAMMKGIIA